MVAVLQRVLDARPGGRGRRKGHADEGHPDRAAGVVIQDGPSGAPAVIRSVPRSGRCRRQGRATRRSPASIRPSRVAWLSFWSKTSSNGGASTPGTQSERRVSDRSAQVAVHAGRAFDSPARAGAR